MSATQERVSTAITALFVPGDRPDRFLKATASGADLVIIDLEDAVAPAAKEDALSATLAALTRQLHPVRALVRINGTASPTHETEVAALTELATHPGHGLVGLMMPKAEDPSALAVLAGKLKSCGTEPLALVALVESGRGVSSAEVLATVAGTTRLAFGAIDLSLDLDCEPDSETVSFARSRVVIASRSAGIAAPLGSPSTAIRDLEAVRKEARHARRNGCGGMLCIHPAQLGVVAKAFTPTADEVAWAERVAAAGDSTVQIDHQMVDRPVLERARRILRVAGATR